MPQGPANLARGRDPAVARFAAEMTEALRERLAGGAPAHPRDRRRAVAPA